MVVQLQIRHVDATPYATSLIEGHRDFGYTFKIALAYIIDNSITSNARAVQLIANTFTYELKIALADDGSGMTQADLVHQLSQQLFVVR